MHGEHLQTHTERLQLRLEPKTFLLRGNSANHHTTMPP